MNEKTTKTNPNGEAIYRVLAEHKGETLAFAEIANLANIEAKTGYLTAAKKVAKDHKQTILKAEGAVKTMLRTCTEYPNGLKIEKTKDAFVDGYQLIDGLVEKQ